MDIVDDPNFVRDLLDFIVQCRAHWDTQRCDFVGTSPRDEEAPGNWFSNCYVDYRSVHVSDFYSDEVDGNMISADAYEKIIFPSELKLAQFYGKVRYYHSCGNLTPLLDTLTKLPRLNILHVSSWTNLAVAHSKCPSSITLQKAMHPQNDVMDASEDKIRGQVRKILATVPDRRLLLCADAIYEGDIDKVRTWLRVAKEVVNS
jgi:hypothetical protein